MHEILKSLTTVLHSEYIYEHIKHCFGMVAGGKRKLWSTAQNIQSMVAKSTHGCPSYFGRPLHADNKLFKRPDTVKYKACFFIFNFVFTPNKSMVHLRSLDALF